MALLPSLSRLERLFRAARRRVHRRRSLALLLGSVIALPLAGCGALYQQRPLVLYLAVSTPGDERITAEVARTLQARVHLLVEGFRRLHPNVVVQITLYPEHQLLSQIRSRTRSGLGPDVIMTTADPANGLLRQGLSLPMPDPRRDGTGIDPVLLRRVTAPNGDLSGMPLVLYTQMACFDRRRVPEAPTDVRRLLELSADGVRVGMALQLRSLFWSAGSLGAVPALQAAAEGKRPDAAQRQGIGRWLRWLQNASIQKNVTFVAKQEELRDGFRRGRFDWISCSSSDLPALQAALGERLGIATLPDGDGDGERASPVNPLQVLVLGRNSSPDQRRMAIALSRFSVKPLVQRSLTLEEMVFLPVNRHVELPVQSSQVLATLVAARGQGEGEGEGALLARLHALDPRVEQLESVLVSLVFGAIEPEQALSASLRILGGPP